MSSSRDEVDRIIEQGGDADDVLRAVVAALISEPEIGWAGIRFLEAGSLVLGPSAGTPDEPRRHPTPIAFRGDRVGELVVDGAANRALLDHVAAQISPYVLLGWDTGGNAWEP
ncbi:MAG: hypothetical protein ABI927_02625 [Gaiellaceae bacterium]